MRRIDDIPFNISHRVSSLNETAKLFMQTTIRLNSFKLILKMNFRVRTNTNIFLRL